MKSPAIVAMLGAILLTSCSSELGSSERKGEAPSISPSQEAAISDGAATLEEYESGYRQFVSCMSEAGYEVLEQGTTGRIYQYSYPVEAIDSGASVSCLDYHFKSVDLMWQMANVDTNATSNALRDCLTAAGVVPGETRALLEEQLEQNNLDFMACADQYG